jgi:hypothetical protein
MKFTSLFFLLAHNTKNNIKCQACFHFLVHVAQDTGRERERESVCVCDEEICLTMMIKIVVLAKMLLGNRHVLLLYVHHGHVKNV